jgi:hypothetical protein
MNKIVMGALAVLALWLSAMGPLAATKVSPTNDAGVQSSPAAAIESPTFRLAGGAKAHNICKRQCKAPYERCQKKARDKYEVQACYPEYESCVNKCVDRQMN